jgi:serine/threonine protein kinase
MPLASTTTNQFRQLFALQSINSQPSAMETSEIGIVTTTNSAEKTVDDDTGIKMLNNYIMMDTIGEGACGKVKLAFSLERNISVAIKIVKKSLLAAGDGDMSRSLGRAQDNREIALRREIAIMKKLRHKNLVALYEVIDDPAAAKLYLVMQYVDHGCVTQMRTDGTCDRLDPLRLANLAAQIASGLKYLHEHDVVHRDIKPENLLVDHDDHLYLSDFGVSELMSAKKDRLAPHRQNSVVDSQGGSSPPDSPTTSLPSRSTPHNTLRLVGTPLFMAPELHDPNSEGRAWTVADRVAIDMWAFGVTLYALLMGRLPFPSIRHILDDAAPLNFSWPTSSVSTASPVSSEWRALIRSLLHRDVTKRPTADVIRRAAKAINRQLNAEQQKTEPSAAAELQMVPRTPKVLVTDEDVESAFSSVDERRGSNSNLIAVSQRFSRQIAASQDEFVSVGEKVSGGNGDEGMFVQVSETKELSDEEPPISPTIDDEFDEPRRGSDGRNGRPSPQEVHHLHGWHHHHTAGGGDGVRHVHASHAPKGLSPSGVEL